MDPFLKKDGGFRASRGFFCGLNFKSINSVTQQVTAIASSIAWTSTSVSPLRSLFEGCRRSLFALQKKLHPAKVQQLIFTTFVLDILVKYDFGSSSISTFWLKFDMILDEIAASNLSFQPHHETSQPNQPNQPNQLKPAQPATVKP